MFFADTGWTESRSINSSLGIVRRPSARLPDRSSLSIAKRAFPFATLQNFTIILVQLLYIAHLSCRGGLTYGGGFFCSDIQLMGVGNLDNQRRSHMGVDLLSTFPDNFEK